MTAVRSCTGQLTGITKTCGNCAVHLGAPLEPIGSGFEIEEPPSILQKNNTGFRI